MVYQAVRNQADKKQEPEPISKRQLLGKIKTYGTESGLSKHVEARFGSVLEDGFLSEGFNGGLCFQPEGCFFFKYLRIGNRIAINEDGIWKKYQFVATAKDMTEYDLTRYANKIFGCVFETERGAVSGMLLEDAERGYIAGNASLESGRCLGRVDIPDNAMITIYNALNGEMVDWGVTELGSDDSVIVRKKAVAT